MTNEAREMIKILDEQTVEVNLPSEIGYERIAMECSASFAKILGLTQERIEDLKTAVSEACLNAIEHGNKGRPEARVTVKLSRGDDALRVAVIDEGDGIGELPKEPEIERKLENLEPPRGLGIYLIKHLVDHVEFNAVSTEGHMVTMVIRLPG
jgi:serine/threonine-protein kinase RsbW